MSDQENLNTTTKKSLLGGLICGVCGAVGGLIDGPIGIGVGSAIGGLIGATFLSFRSAPDVIQNEMTPNEKRDILSRGLGALADTKEFLIRTVLQMLSQLKDCKTFEDFKKRVLLPLLGELIGLGAEQLIRMVIAMVQAA